MQDIDLDKLERLASACFAGPWRAETWSVECSCIDACATCGDPHEVHTVTAPEEYPRDTEAPQVVAHIDEDGDGKIVTPGLARYAATHAAFIAAARDAVPRLVARVRELERHATSSAKISNVDVRDLWVLVLSTVRYSMGRQTYISELAPEIALRHGASLTPEQRAQIVDEIEKELSFSISHGRTLGGSCDHASWTEYARRMREAGW